MPKKRSIKRCKLIYGSPHRGNAMSKAKRTTATAAELFNRCSGRFERVERNVKNSAVKFLEGVWKDFQRDLKQAFVDAFELGLEGRNLQETFFLIDKLVDPYRDRLEKLARELKLKFSKELLRELDRKAELALSAFEQLLKLLHVLYLHSGDEFFLNLAVLLYAFYKSESLDAVYAAAGLGKFLAGEYKESFALAAYSARAKLPRKPPADQKPWENPEEWARALKLSYHYEVGMRVVAELLHEWGIADALRDAFRKPE